MFHADTTDVSVYGTYESASPDALQITHGYNRHHRWQKQIGFGLIGNEDGIPFYGDVHDGNLPDKTWNPEVLSRVQKQLKQAKIEDEWIYVADSAAMTKDTLAQTKAANAFLITRGPSSLRIVKTALAKADAQDTPWSDPFSLAEKNGATYRVWETTSTYEGHSVRLIVVESSALDQRKGKTLEKERNQEAELLRQKQTQWESRLFSCREDAEQALASLKASLRLRFHRVEASVEAIVRPKKRRGRPSHFEARDAFTPSEKKAPKTPKKRGRKTKAERAVWLAEQVEKKGNPSTYEKELKEQLDIPLETLWKDVPIEPKWGVKKNSKGKNTFWFGYKAHLAVSTKSQYIITRLMSSGNLSDCKAAIPLLKKLHHFGNGQFTIAIFDAGYDVEPIYRQAVSQSMRVVIPYNVRREGEYIGFDEHFRPTCVREHRYQ